LSVGARFWGTVSSSAFCAALIILKRKLIRGGFPGGFAGNAPVLTFGGPPEYERFSPDKDWMPRMVLIAKTPTSGSTSFRKPTKRDIRTLDQIPDEELDRLAGSGISGLC